MRLLFFSFAFALAFACMLLPASMCAAVPSSAGITEGQLQTIENKLLQKTYEQDPLTKRLQRIELVIFGATQYGSNEQRWQNIKHYLSDSGASKSNISSSLNELEKYVFKKTTPAESASRRLSKLETKLFGQPSPSMPTANRIERLQRTLGLAATPNDMAALPPSVRGMPNMMTPGGMPMFGFGNNFGFDGDDMGMSQMMREMQQMQQQMQQMQPHGFNQQSPGYEEHRFYMYSTPDGGFKFGTEPDNNFNPKHRNPNGKKGSALPAPQPQPIMPQPNVPEERIPSYADPNFI